MDDLLLRKELRQFFIKLTGVEPTAEEIDHAVAGHYAQMAALKQLKSRLPEDKLEAALQALTTDLLKQLGDNRSKPV